MIINKQSKIGCHCWGTVESSVAGIGVFSEIGCKWVRVTRPFQMDIVATGYKSYDFRNNGEDSVNKIVEKNMTVLGLLDARFGHESKINMLSWASPIWDHLDIWEDYVRQTVTYYMDRVKYWEVINEPPFFWLYPTVEGQELPEIKPPLKRAPIEKYAMLLKSTAKVIREIDPEAKILMGSSFPDGEFLASLYKHGCKDYFDVVSVHYLPCKNHDDFEYAIENLKRVMRKNGDDDKAIWDTENGSFGAIVGNAVETPGEYESNYNIYRHCFSYEFNLERYFWFNQIENNEFNEYLSIYSQDGNLAPRYNSIKVLHDIVGESTLKAYKHIDGEVHIYVFEGTKSPVSIIWSTGTATIEFDKPKLGTDLYGDTLNSSVNYKLDGKPFYLEGNVLDEKYEVIVTGKRDAINECIKQPGSDVMNVSSTRTTSELDINSEFWNFVPAIINKEEMPLYHQENAGYLQPDSVRADVKIAHDDNNIYFLIDNEVVNSDNESTGLVQFSIRDSNPDIIEWPYFFNGYAVFNLFASKTGDKFLRYSSLFLREYPSGIIPTAKMTSQKNGKGIRIFASLPFSEIGPCKFNKNNPFLMMFTFMKTNNMLDVPPEDRPEEWGNNFMDVFICRKPELTAWVKFD